MITRIDRAELLDTLSQWDRYLKRKVHCIACGGTALTLINVKESTKDIDLIIPKSEDYKYLINILIDLGYSQITGSGWQREKGLIFDLFVGKTVFTTELLESPLESGNHFLYKEYSSLYLGILNYYDLIITKLFRYTSVDVEDCLFLLHKRQNEIDIEKLKARFIETSSYDISDEKNLVNFEYFMRTLKNNNEK